LVYIIFALEQWAVGINKRMPPLAGFFGDKSLKYSEAVNTPEKSIRSAYIGYNGSTSSFSFQVWASSEFTVFAPRYSTSFK
jgi:hypothetical protein